MTLNFKSYFNNTLLLYLTCWSPIKDFFQKKENILIKTSLKITNWIIPMALSHPETSPILWMSTGQNPCLQRERHLLEKIKNKTWWNSAQLCKLPPDIISILLLQCYLYICRPKRKPTLPSPPCIHVVIWQASDQWDCRWGRKFVHVCRHKVLRKCIWKEVCLPSALFFFSLAGIQSSWLKL